jgi:hypothetical protein
LRVITFEDHLANELVAASYVEQRRWLRWATLALGFLAGLILLVTLFTELVFWPVLMLGFLATLSGAAWGAFEWRYQSYSGLRGQLRAGLAGQRLVPQILSGLDDGYYLINNLKLPGRADDVDHVLVGPNGIFALETKNHRGRIFWREGQWYQSKMSQRGRRQPDEPIRDPTQQLKRNIDYLRSCINHTNPYLSRRTRLWIEGVVVFTHPAVSLDLPDQVQAVSPFPVVRARDVPSHIIEHVPRRRHTKTEVRQIVSMLGHLQCPYPSDRSH